MRARVPNVRLGRMRRARAAVALAALVVTGLVAGCAVYPGHDDEGGRSYSYNHHDHDRGDRD